MEPGMARWTKEQAEKPKQAAIVAITLRLDLMDSSFNAGDDSAYYAKEEPHWHCGTASPHGLLLSGQCREEDHQFAGESERAVCGDS
jgi:hypothetical protein